MGITKITKDIVKHTFINYDLVGGPDSFQRIVDQIAAQDFDKYYQSVKGYHNKLMEMDYSHGVPPTNEMFYGYYGTYKVLMQWTSFIETYKDKYMMPDMKNPGFMTFRHKNPRFHYAFQEEELDCKLLKMYMSFLKEQHLMHWLYSRDLKTAYWSLSADDNDGLDIMVRNPRGKLYGHKVYIDSPLGRKYAEEKKNKRHVAVQKLYERGISVLSIPVPLGDGNKIGDTNVTEPEVLECLYHIIMLGIDPVTFEQDANGNIRITRELVLRKNS